jgi:hypothetical protein
MRYFYLFLEVKISFDSADGINNPGNQGGSWNVVLVT